MSIAINRSLELTPERISRFWAKVERRSPDECWPWLGDMNTGGHGVYREWSGNRHSVRFYAHRLSLLVAGVDITGKIVRHDCDNPPCVNPNHLQVGSQADNVRDAIERGRLNTDGLALGRTFQRPPRPCRTCESQLIGGRHIYCGPCRVEATRESRRRWKEKQRESAAVDFERRRR